MKAETNKPDIKSLEIGDQQIQNLIDKLNKYLDFESPDRNQYMNSTVIKDVIYLLGVSIDEDIFSSATGFDRFTEILKEVLK